MDLTQKQKVQCKIDKLEVEITDIKTRKKALEEKNVSLQANESILETIKLDLLRINIDQINGFYKDIVFLTNELNKYEAKLDELTDIPSAKRFKIQKDITFEILSKYEQDACIDSLTPIENVIQIVNHKLAYPIPIDIKYSELIPQLTANSPSFRNLIEFTNDKMVSLKFSGLFHLAINDDFEPGCGESSLICYIDNLIKKPMAFLSKFLKNYLQFGRNKSDKSNRSSAMTETRKQPDFLAWNLNSILVFKGEEKEREEHFYIAEKEILDKCGEMHEMFFGSIPFLFCYVAAGKLLQFFVVDRHKNIIPTSKSRFDMSSVQDRLEIVVTVLNITWCINAYRKFCKNVVYRFNYWIPRHKNVSMYFSSSGLTKTIDLTKEKYDLAELNDVKDIYELIKKNDITNTIKCESVKLSKSSFTVLLNPICLPYEVYKVDSNEELLKALKAVTNALKFLHAYNYVHRDVRWDNILFDSKSNSYLLTDFECAGKADAPLPSLLRNSITIDYPSKIKEGNIYTKQADFYLIGKLIENKQKENIFTINQQILELIRCNSNKNAPLFDLESEQLTAENIINYLNKIVIN